MPPSKQPPVRWDAKRLLICFGVIAWVTWLAFSPSLANGFTHWDDDVYVLDNLDIRAFTLENVRRVFSSSYGAGYQPLTMLTYMVDYHFFRLDPKAYHTTDLILHVANALLVFSLMLRLTRRYGTSLLVSLLFAVHPLRVESVAWIAERKDVLSAFFYLLSLLFYVSHMGERRPRYYWLCLLALLLSLLSKPMAVSQPLVLLLIDRHSNRRLDRKAVLAKTPFFVTVSAFAVITFLVQATARAIPEYAAVPILQRLCVPFYGLVFYLVKTLLPVRLCSLYPLPPQHPGGTVFVLYAAPLLVLAGAVALYRARACSRVLVFGSLFYLVTVLPVLQVVPFGHAIAADRFTYIPLLGPCLVLAQLCQFLFERQLGSGTARSALGIGLAGTILVLANLTYHRCGVWKDRFSLWNDAIAKYPSAAAYNHRGAAYVIEGMYDRAIEDLDQAIRLAPRYFEAYDNRGIARTFRGDYDLAIEDHTEAIRLNARDALAYSDRALAYLHQGKLARAREDLDEAIRLQPTATAYKNRGIIRNAMGNYRRAIEDFDASVRLDPDHRAAYFHRGLSHEATGNPDRALRDFRRACALGHHAACGRPGSK
ncbi:MAG: tetratricopeptide repeat protein [Polyangiaceae bacterium]|nr:tetratricopeptide repeat protein [Polyangiaceae bacterium]